MLLWPLSIARSAFCVNLILGATCLIRQADIDYIFNVIILIRLFPLSPALVAVVAVIANHVFPAVGDVRGQLGQPVQGREYLAVTASLD